jgi:formate dehydrogenase major subunit
VSDPASLNRRDFLGGGFVLGGLLGLGFDLRAARAEVGRFKFADTHEVPSVCPYCAVGCGQLVSVRGGKIVNIEGNPDSPINRGTLCPKGSATYQLVVNPNRLTKVKYRAPYATDWQEVSLEWAMERIAARVKETRDAHFTETWRGKGQDGQEVEKRVNHCAAIGSLGGATLDNEWNYAQLKLWRALGGIWIENQARL